MQIHQLNPVLPVLVVASQGWVGPVGKGMAIAWFQEGIDHHLTWVVVMDETGQVCQVENPHIRFPANYTWGRNAIG